MNLLERLKPEFKEKLEGLKDKYPASYKSIKRSLEENTSYTTLVFDEVNNLFLYFDLKKVYEIASLFKHD